MTVYQTSQSIERKHTHARKVVKFILMFQKYVRWSWILTGVQSLLAILQQNAFTSEQIEIHSSTKKPRTKTGWRKKRTWTQPNYNDLILFVLVVSKTNYYIFMKPFTNCTLHIWSEHHRIRQKKIGVVQIFFRSWFYFVSRWRYFVSYGKKKNTSKWMQRIVVFPTRFY